jgi:DNA uptake protein ComE-like DNA-binding protein
MDTRDLLPARRRPLWPWISLVPLGLGAWAPILAGVRARVRHWVWLGLLWSAIVVAGITVAGSTNAHDHGIGGLLIIVGWTGAIATSFSIRAGYDERVVDTGLSRAERAARRRIAERQRARELARANPALALEMGIGRPDLDDAASGWVIDVNHVPEGVLRRLPGVTEELAARIAAARAQNGGFASVEDMGAAADLPPEVVEAARPLAVFLPGTTA